MEMKNIAEKENRIVESLCQVDFSELEVPLVTVYEQPWTFRTLS